MRPKATITITQEYLNAWKLSLFIVDTFITKGGDHLDLTIIIKLLEV